MCPLVWNATKAWKKVLNHLVSGPLIEISKEIWLRLRSFKVQTLIFAACVGMRSCWWNSRGCRCLMVSGKVQGSPTNASLKKVFPESEKTHSFGGESTSGSVSNPNYKDFFLFFNFWLDIDPSIVLMQSPILRVLLSVIWKGRHLMTFLQHDALSIIKCWPLHTFGHINYLSVNEFVI